MDRTTQVVIEWYAPYGLKELFMNEKRNELLYLLYQYYPKNVPFDDEQYNISIERKKYISIVDDFDNHMKKPVNY
jgi:hypothetical protein